MSLLSKEEREVIDNLVKAWNAFLKLEELHSDHTIDFKEAIHKAQYIVMVRPVQREFKKIE